MKIDSVAKAGTLESNDILIMVMPNPDGGIKIELESIVKKQFGYAINNSITEKLKEMKVEECKVIAQDKGALDYTIKARVETAILRALNKDKKDI